MSRFWSVVVAAVLGASLVVATPNASAAAVAGDTYGLVDPATGIWHLYGGNQETFTFYFGNPGDYPFMGDWNCDNIDTPGLYRQSDGYVYLRNTNTQGIANISFYFGNPGDVPIAGDFNGDGCDTVSIYRPSNQTFYIINKLGTNDGGLGAADYSFVFGNPGDKPFVGDFNGNGQDTIGLHRESTGLVYFRITNTQGNADKQFIFGDPGDRLVAGDWNRNGADSPGLFRPSNTTMYLRYSNSQGNADESAKVGESDWLPVAGNFGSPEAFLISLDPVSGRPDKAGAAEVSARVYQDSFQESGLYYDNPEDTTYLLSGLYEKFTAVAGVRDNSQTNDVGYIIQLLDENAARIWSSTVTIGAPVPVEVDISGVLRLTVRVIRQGGTGSDYAVLGDAKVGGAATSPPTGNPLPAPPPSGRYLIDLDPVSGRPDKEGPAAVSGRVYPDSFQESGLYYDNPEDTTYLLSGLYSKFTALAGVRDDSPTNDVGYIIQLYDTVTGAQLWSQTVTIGAPKPVDVNVSGVLRLLVRVIRQGGTGSDYAVLADARVGGPGLTPP